MAYKTNFFKYFKSFWKVITSETAQSIYLLLFLIASVVGIVGGIGALFTESEEERERRLWFERQQHVNDSLDVVIAKHKAKKQAQLDSINNIEKVKNDSIANYLFVNRDSLQNLSATKSLTDYGLKVSKMRCEVLGRSATATKCQYIHNNKLVLTDCKIVSMGKVDCVPNLFNSSIKQYLQF